MSSLSYELCKELKDAGFPFREKLPEDFAVIRAGGKPLAEATIIDGFKCFYPTLEELIAAVGEDFIWLRRGGNTFSAHGDIVIPDSYDGSTPSEAVARLYLALNAK